MKLRNKRTGEVKEFALFNGKELQGGATLKDLAEEWEDYEEPVGYWYITEQGIPGRINFSWDTKESIENHKEIGNYFETYKEAEQAVEKLKAWKRLKDKGFEIIDWAVADGYELRLFAHYSRAGIKDDLDLLFGGKDV